MMAARILVVDDDKQIVRLVPSYLEQAGMTTFPAYDGEEALHFLRAERPDLVVLDLMLPNRDGWEITRILRSDERLANIPILMLTARVEDGDKIFDTGCQHEDRDIRQPFIAPRSEEHTSELQSPDHLVCRLLLEKKKKKQDQ